MSSNAPFGWATLGAVVIGAVTAVSIALVEHLRQERRRQNMAQDLDRLNTQVVGLRDQLDMLQRTSASLQQQPQKKRVRRGTALSSYTNSVDGYSSAMDSCSDVDEFYDLSDDDEEDSSRASTITALDSMFKDVDEKLDDPKQLHKVLNMLECLLVEYPDNAEVLWRIGKSHHRLSSQEEHVETKMEHFKLGLEACQRALALNGQSGDGHKWYAILVGSRSTHQSIRDKLRDSMEFKRHVDIAIELKPDDAVCYHLLGRYNYEITSLKWYEKKAAETIFEKLPECSFERALEHLFRADRIGPQDWKENMLFIAKCYISMQKHHEAVVWLEKASQVTVRLPDPNVDADVKVLLKKYKDK